MARLVVFALDRIPHSDARLEAQRFTRGDVIEVGENNAYFGEDPVRLAMFRIIKVPGRARDYAHLKSGDVADIERPDKLTRIRLRSLDLDLLEADERAARRQSKLEDRDEVVTSRRRLAAVIRDRAEQVDPRVFGRNDRVIG